MNLNEYTEKTLETAIYPGAGTGNNAELTYLALGLASEAGEVAGKIKKLIRDNRLDVGALAYEIGDVFWYLCRLSESIGYEPEDILKLNYEKLQRRKQDNTIAGNGDNR